MHTGMSGIDYQSSSGTYFVNLFIHLYKNSQLTNLCKAEPLVLENSGLPGQQAGTVNFDFHVSQLHLDTIKIFIFTFQIFHCQ